MYKSIYNATTEDFKRGAEHAIVVWAYGMFAFVIVSVVTVGAVFITAISQ